MSRPESLEERIGHRFQRAELLEQALTHRSYGTPHNERMEFLGDSVLGCVVAETLFTQFPALTEGELSRLRASLVRKEALAAVAREVGLAGHLRMGQGESTSGGADRPSILADALEAVYGAAFLDGGYDCARRVVLRTLGKALETSDERTGAKDPKTLLQEILQGRRQSLPVYQVLATLGAAHQQTFEVECVVESLGLRAQGQGDSRRAAEQKAAQALLRQLGA